MHQDVCPKNILVFEEPVLDNVDTGPHLAPNYCFKLADLGISHFELATEGFRDVLSRDKPGTQAFGMWDYELMNILLTGVRCTGSISGNRARATIKYPDNTKHRHLVTRMRIPHIRCLDSIWSQRCARI